VKPLFEPVPAERVRLAPGSLLGDRVETNRRVTIPHCLALCEETGRLRNFDRAAGALGGAHEGRRYDDSDVYKTIEGAAHALRRRHDSALERRVDDAVARIAAAARPDGYLNTYFTVAEPDRRWTDVGSGHELYCAGHLIEAGLALARANRDRRLLDVGIRCAEHVDSVFGPGRRTDPPGHQEIELALTRLAAFTSEERWRRLARFFLERRGSGAYGEYAQDHLPVAEQREAVGHAVRALRQYLATTELTSLDTVFDLWEDVTERKTYVTGGVGGSAENEGFRATFDLPIDGAYCETCAAIELCRWAHGLALVTGERRFTEVLETALLNAALAGVSLSGDRFFYSNPLESDGRRHRQRWFDCACCPTNAARFFASLPGAVLATRGDAVLVLLPTAGQAEIELSRGTVFLKIETDWPWDGEVRITVSCPKPTTFEILFPERGRYRSIRRTWTGEETLDRTIRVRPERVRADPRVEACRGRVALRRGPVVYCVEEADGGPFELPARARIRERREPDRLGGIVTLRAENGLTAVPYAVWDHRDPGRMEVWLRER